MTREELKKIMENHSHWLHHDCEGWESMRANLSGADLSGADLSGVDLHYANLYRANLYKAYLNGADLRCADLSGADLSRVDLRGTFLCDADLRGANLSDAYLSGADLRCADLIGADLNDAELSGAYLSCTELYSVKNMPFVPMVCPEEGDFIAWKKASEKIIKLHIPSDAKRSSATTRKCRCNKAEVLEIYNLDGTVANERQVTSDYDYNFIYEVGKTVEVNDFDDNRWKECTTGIHFFMQKQEAILYR